MATVEFNNLPKFNATVIESLNRGLTRAADALAGRMKESMSTSGRYTASPPGSPPNVRRGGLRNSIHGTQGVNLSSSAGSGIDYALTQERGGVLRPRVGKFLPVPINVPAMRQSEKFGSVTQYIQGVSGVGFLRSGGLRQLDLIVIRSKGGGLFLMGKSPVKVRWNVGKGGWLGSNAVPVWALKRSITLPARPWAKPALEKNRGYILEQFSLGAARAMREGLVVGIS